MLVWVAIALLTNLSHSFIVRIWVEPREIPGEPAEIRGMIEHAASGERRYFRDLVEMVTFIAKYVSREGPGFGTEIHGSVGSK